MDKRELIKQLKDGLAREIAVLERAAEAAREAATHEESRPENDKDTRGLEAAYLAGAEAKRVKDLEAIVNALEFLPLRAFGEGDTISASALIEVELDEKRLFYFMAPLGGGLRAEVGGVEILVITPQSPVGRALLGKAAGDVVEVQMEKRKREYEIIRIT